MASNLVVFLIVVFDVIAFGLAVAAEQHRSKAKDVADAEKNYTYCVYDSDIATGYGAGAFLFLMSGQITVMAASKCFCCGRALRTGGSRTCAVVLFVASWVTFLIAEACLLAGSVQNAYHTRYRAVFIVDPPSCQTLRKGVFAAGGAFAFFTAMLSICYYRSYSRADYDGYSRESAVAMTPYG